MYKPLGCEYLKTPKTHNFRGTKLEEIIRSQKIRIFERNSSDSDLDLSGKV